MPPSFPPSVPSSLSTFVHHRLSPSLSFSLVGTLQHHLLYISGSFSSFPLLSLSLLAVIMHRHRTPHCITRHFPHSHSHSFSQSYIHGIDILSSSHSSLSLYPLPHCRIGFHALSLTPSFMARSTLVSNPYLHSLVATTYRLSRPTTKSNTHPKNTKPHIHYIRARIDSPFRPSAPTLQDISLMIIWREQQRFKGTFQTSGYGVSTFPCTLGMLRTARESVGQTLNDNAIIHILARLHS